jgi:arylsulfatase A-like enzyme
MIILLLCLFIEILENIRYLPLILYTFKNPIGLHKNIQFNKATNKLNTPNIILIIADDLGYNDLFRNITPNINSLKSNGIEYTNAYAGQATCAPSRVAIYTGIYPTKLGFEFTPIPKSLVFAGYLFNSEMIVNFDKTLNVKDMNLPLEYPLISNVLKEHGYYNYFLGKWHIGGNTPIKRGYDESLSFLYGSSAYDIPNNIFSVINNNTYEKFVAYNSPYAISYNDGPNFKPNEYMTDYLTNNAIDIINLNNDTTYFLTLAYNAPHSPLQALKSDYYELDYIKDHNKRVYCAMIKALDRGVGKIINAIKDTNTMIIFTSDNGGSSYINIDDLNYPYRGWKSTYFEGGIKVPLIIHYPKLIKHKIKYDKIVHHVDIFPTILNIIKSNKTYYTNGIDLFNNKSHNILFWRTGDYICLRYYNWKLSISNLRNKTWMYNLNDDPYEENNYKSNKIFNYLYNILVRYNSSQKLPLWNSTIAVPIKVNDDYVYWNN